MISGLAAIRESSREVFERDDYLGNAEVSGSLSRTLLEKETSRILRDAHAVAISQSSARIYVCTRSLARKNECMVLSLVGPYSARRTTGCRRAKRALQFFRSKSNIC